MYPKKSITQNANALLKNQDQPTFLLSPAAREMMTASAETLRLDKVTTALGFEHGEKAVVSTMPATKSTADIGSRAATAFFHTLPSFIVVTPNDLAQATAREAGRSTGANC